MEVNGENCSRPGNGNRNNKENSKWGNSGNAKVRCLKINYMSKLHQ